MSSYNKDEVPQISTNQEDLLEYARIMNIEGYTNPEALKAFTKDVKETSPEAIKIRKEFGDKLRNDLMWNKGWTPQHEVPLWEEANKKLSEDIEESEGLLTEKALLERGWIPSIKVYYVERVEYTKDNLMMVVDWRSFKYPVVHILARDVTKIQWLPDTPEEFRVVLPIRDIKIFDSIIELANYSW